MGRGPRGLWNMGDVPFVKLFTKSIGLGISGLYGSIGFARFQHFTVAPTSRHALSTMRERGAAGDLPRLGAQAVEGEGVTLRRLRARGSARAETAQRVQREGLATLATRRYLTVERLAQDEREATSRRKRRAGWTHRPGSAPALGGPADPGPDRRGDYP